MKPSTLKSKAATAELKITRHNRATYILGSIGIIALVLTSVVLFSLWQSIFFGAVIALTVHPFFHKLHRWTGRRRIAGGVVCILTLLIVIGPLLSLLGALIQQFTAFVQTVPTLLPQIIAKINQYGSKVPFLPEIHLSLDTLNKYFATKADTILQTLSAFTIGQAVMWTDFLTEVAIAFLVAYFALVDGPMLKSVIVRKFQVSESSINDFVTNVRRAGRSIMLGTVTAAAAQALLIGAAFTIAKLPGAILAGAVTFGFAFIPLLGSWPVAVVGVALAATMGMTQAAIIVTVFGIIAGLADNIVRVWVSKEEEHIHPLLVFLAILGGLEVMGPLGVIFGPMLLTILYQLSDRIREFIIAIGDGIKTNLGLWKTRSHGKLTRSKQRV